MTTTEYREIPLTQGQAALVDEADFERLSKWKWCAVWIPSVQSFYAMRSSTTVNGKRNSIYMHRAIMEAPPGLEVDHRGHNTLDNRRNNLRRATCTQNHQNARIRSSTTSGFKGVSFHKGAGKWRAGIRVNGESIWLGLHATPELAHAAYIEAAREHFGEFACDGRPD
jgi:hypothetical protein